METSIINNHLMDAILMQSSLGDNKRAFEKNGAEIRDQMDDNLKVQDKTGDYKVSNHKSKENLPAEDLTGQTLDENLKMDAGSTENLSEGNENGKRKKRVKRKNKKATIKDEVQTIDQTETDEGKKASIKEEVQSMDQTKMDEGKKAATKDEVQSIDQTKMDEGSTENLSEGNANGKKKKRLKRKKEEATIKDEVQSIDQTGTEEGKKASMKDEVQSMDQTKMDEGKKAAIKDEVQSIDQTKMDEGSTENLSEGNANGKKKKMLKRKDEEATIKDEVQSIDQTETDEGKKASIKDEVQNMDQTKMDEGSTENLSVGNANGKKKKRLKRKKKGATIRAEVQSIDQAETDEGKKATIKDEVQKMDQTEMDIGSTENLSEGNANGKNSKRLKRKKKKKKKAAIKDEVQSIDQTKTDEGKKATIKDEVQSMDQIEMDDRKKATIKDEVQIIDQTKMDEGKNSHSIDQTKMDKGKKATIIDEVQSIDQAKMDEGKKATIIDEVQSIHQTKMDEGKKATIIDDVQSIHQTKMDEGKKATIIDEVQSINQMKMDEGKKATIIDEVQSIDQTKLDEGMKAIKDEGQSIYQMKMDEGSTENFSEGNANRKKKKRLKRKKMKATIKDEVQSIDQTKMDEGQKATIKDEVQSIDQTKMDEGKKATNKDEVQSVGETKMDEGSTENLAEGNVTEKSKRKRKRIKQAKIKDEVQSVGTKMDAGSTENLADGKLTIHNPKIKDEAQGMDQAKMDIVPTGDFAEGNVTGKKKKKRKNRKKAKTEGEFQCMSQDGSTSNLHLSDEKCGWRIYSKLGSDYINNCGPLARSMELEGKLFPCESQQTGHPNLPAGQKGKSENELSEVSNKIILDEDKGSAERRSLFSTCSGRVTMNFSSFNMKDAEGLFPKMAPITSIRRKLLVLDVNGLLADIVFPAPKHCGGDIKIYGRAVFRRPFCDDFLKFCFQNFDVGIWSSRSKRIIDEVVSYLLGDQKDKLLFCWDMKHSTKTGFKTLENSHKPLVCKELRKIWENDDPNLPWKKGDYNESNTLLLDDSPYKALLNPLHTAIFPYPYRYFDKNDNSLDSEGDLRVYLKGLATSENVQKYVEQHPFGQKAISEQNWSWGFYSRVLHQMSNPLKDKTPPSIRTSS